MGALRHRRRLRRALPLPGRHDRAHSPGSDAAAEVGGRTHVDVGAADGKVLLGALSLGAAHVYGVEISGDGLQTKFEGMRDVLAQSHGMGASSARLACSIDICDLRGGTVEAWLNEVFNESDDTEITVSAVWHGYVYLLYTTMTYVI